MFFYYLNDGLRGVAWLPPSSQNELAQPLHDSCSPLCPFCNQIRTDNIMAGHAPVLRLTIPIFVPFLPFVQGIRADFAPPMVPPQRFGSAQRKFHQRQYASCQRVRPWGCPSSLARSPRPYFLLRWILLGMPLAIQRAAWDGQYLAKFGLLGLRSPGCALRIRGPCNMCLYLSPTSSRNLISFVAYWLVPLGKVSSCTES